MNTPSNQPLANGELLADPAHPRELPVLPSGLQAIRILARTALRRWLNRMSRSGTTWWRKKSTQEPAGGRKATPGKDFTLIWNSLLVGLIFLLVGNFLGCTFVLNEARYLSQRSQEGAQESSPGPQEQRLSDDDTERLLHSGAAWPLPPDDRLMVLAVGLALGLLSLCQLTAVLGYGSQDLGKVGWDMEWLFTLPVPAWVLFLGRLVQYATTGQMIWWCLAAPFLASIYWCAGYGWWAIPLALAAVTFGSLLTASLGLVVETWAQKRLSPARRKNLQAILGLMGGWSFVVFFMLPGLKVLDNLVTGGFTWVPVLTWANPFALPALLCVKGPVAGAAAALMALLGVGLPTAAVGLTGWMVRDGLVATPNANQATRRRWRADLGKVAGWFRGIAGKDLRLLVRDRAFLVRTLVLPVLVLGLFFFQNWHQGISNLQDATVAPVMAFWLGVLVLGYGAFQVLTAEGNSLWLLCTFPRTLQSLLLEKTLLWCGLASLYTLANLIIAALVGMPLNGEVLIAVIYAVAGIMIHAFIAAAIGVLATDPTETVVQRRPRQDLVWFYRFLWFIYAMGFFLPLWWKVVLVVLYVPLAFAFWQKVQDQIPYLLEPTESPPPRISLADGMVAALAFCILQPLMAFLLTAYFGLDDRSKVSEGTLTLVMEVITGVVVTAVTLFFLRRVPRLLAVTGLILSRTAPHPAVWRSLLLGVAAGVLAGLFAIAYIAAVLWWDAIPGLKETLPSFPSPLAEPALFAVVVLAAPLFEEFLFRALIYQGMERSMRPIFAVLASAAIFAVVHPSISVIPVFILGVAAAFSFQRTRLLWAPIATHMVYNAMVVMAKLVIARWIL
jgi:membrane protease YdiL (CAAX protease family)